MGIRELLPLIKKSAPHLLCNLPHPTTLAGARLAVDGHMLLHRFWYAPKPGAQPLGPKGQPNHHIQYFYNFLELCDYLQVRPTIVFDYGVRPYAKQRVAHKQRAVARNRQLELHGTAIKTVDGLDRHLDKLTLVDTASVEQSSLPREFHHLPDEPLETEEMRLFEQTFQLKEESPPRSDREQVLIGMIRQAIQPLWPQSTLSSEISKELAPSEAVGKRLSSPATADTTSTTMPPPPTNGPAPLPQSNLYSLQLFLGHLIQSTSPPAQRGPTTLMPPTPKPTSSIPTPTDPTATLNDVKLPRTNIHRLLADTLVATTLPTFDPLTSLSSARSRAQKESQRLERTSAGLPHFALYDVLLLLRARGVPTVLTPNFTEAEQLCGALAHLGVVDYAVSDDSDTGVFFPDAYVIRSFFQYNKRPTVLGPLGDLAVALGLVPAGSEKDKVKAALVDFSILAGCDYSTKIPGIGPMNAIKLLKQHGSIEAILEGRPDLRVKMEGDESWDPQEARAVFNNEYLDTDQLLELVNEAAEVADWPLTKPDHRVPDMLENSLYSWSSWLGAGRAPKEVEVMEAAGIKAFDAEAYVQNLMALEPQV